jgi:hypothetical protein
MTERLREVREHVRPARPSGSEDGGGVTERLREVREHVMPARPSGSEDGAA